jgi:hypothetical protein
MDFVHDTLATGRRIRMLTLVDIYSRESPAIIIDTSLSGRRVVRELERICEQRGGQPVSRWIMVLSLPAKCWMRELTPVGCSSI